MSSKVQGMMVCKHYKLVKKLGTGSFGQIYLAENQTNQTGKYAAKLQKTKTHHPQLYFQAKIYKHLNSNGKIIGIPKVYAMTTENQYNVMLMDLLGSNIEELFNRCARKFTLGTVLQIGQQMLDRIQTLHKKELLHRDIKPDNFLLGLGENSNIIYIVDMGLCKRYINNGCHIPWRDGKELTGTARYASINTHRGIEQSRRDDIESIGYVLIYLQQGILPWQNMKSNDTKEKYRLIMQKKISTPVEVLCKGLPSEMQLFINYARSIDYEDQPDYFYLRSLLQTAFKKHNIEPNCKYDWDNKKQFLIKKMAQKTQIQPQQLCFKRKTLNLKSKEVAANQAMSNLYAHSGRSSILKKRIILKSSGSSIATFGDSSIRPKA